MRTTEFLNLTKDIFEPYKEEVLLYLIPDFEAKIFLTKSNQLQPETY
jgi:hypothetical protein